MNVKLINGELHRLRIEQDHEPESPRDWDNLGIMVCWHRNYKLGDEQPSQDPEEFRISLACQLDDTLEARLERKDAWWDDRYPTGCYGTERWKEWHREMNQDIQEAIDAVLAKHIIELPLYLYDHSGITMSTTGFSCHWDSGQVGFIYAEKSKIRQEYGWKRLTQARVERIEKLLNGEVETYDQYLTNDVYAFIHEKAPLPEDWAELAMMENKQALEILNKHLDLEDDLEWDHVDSCWSFYGHDIENNGILEHLDDELHDLARAVA